MSQNGNIKGMDKIPADIARTAKQVSDQLPMVPDDDELEAAIAAAIMAERERCAKVARKWKSSLKPGTEARLLGHKEAAREIADAILGGDQ